MSAEPLIRDVISHEYCEDGHDSCEKIVADDLLSSQCSHAPVCKVPVFDSSDFTLPYLDINISNAILCCNGDVNNDLIELLNDPDEQQAVISTDDFILPKYGWRAELNWKPKVKCHPWYLPRLSQIPPVKMCWRYLKIIYYQNYRNSKKPFINNINTRKCNPIYGVPIGGIGSGSIGRSFTGSFTRSSLIPGLYQYSDLTLCQFQVVVRHENKAIYHKVLSAKPVVTNCAKHNHPTSVCVCRAVASWKWLDEHEINRAVYVGLYPRSWTLFKIYLFDNSANVLLLLCRQLSPVRPHCYVDSCLPAANFQWTVINYTQFNLDVSIVFSWQQGFGSHSENLPKVVEVAGFGPSESNKLTSTPAMCGVLMHQQCDRLNAMIGLAGLQTNDVDVSCLSNFLGYYKSTQGAVELAMNAECVWSYLDDHGTLPPETSEKTHNGAHCSVMAVCSRCHVPSKQYRMIHQNLVWHSPIVRFRQGKMIYKRRYLRWFKEDLRDGTLDLLKWTFMRQRIWEEEIIDWQKPYLSDDSLPDWYKSALFNELYFISDGGTVWLDLHNDKCDGEALKRCSDLLDVPFRRQIGFFGYLEGHEYRMYNTYDVHYYASWALIKLWPKIQFSIQYDMAYYLQNSDSRQQYYLHTNSKSAISEKFCALHDVGDPEDEPWDRVNAYVMYNTKDWKDLNCKFILQVYRDWRLTGNLEYLQFMLPIVKEVVRFSLKWDKDEDGIIDNGGYPDQTYDLWVATGASAYTGGLWIASLYAVCCMLRECQQDVEEFHLMLREAKKNYDAKLWNGEYFDYDESKSAHCKAVMADQLNGYWYLKSSGVACSSLYEDDKILKSLRAILKYNVENVENGRFGAINGMMPNGKFDRSSIQAEEFWVGVNYSLAATMLLQGMEIEAFETAGKCYETVWELFGLQYQVPEAYHHKGIYRSLGYMRPLAIWAMQHSLELNDANRKPYSSLPKASFRFSEQLDGDIETTTPDDNSES